MSDDKEDTWRALADELGVDPSAEPPPPPAPPPATQKSPPPAASAPPPKRSVNWNALAGELGIEVPPEPEPPSKTSDPVAAALGWTQPPARAPEPERRKNWDEPEEGPVSAEDEVHYSRPASSDESRSREGGRDEGERSRRGGRRRGRGGRGRRDEQSTSSRPRADQVRPPRDTLRRDELSHYDEPEDLAIDPAARVPERPDESREGERPRRRRRRRGRGGSERSESRPESRPAHRSERDEVPPAAREAPDVDDLAGENDFEDSFVPTGAGFPDEIAPHVADVDDGTDTEEGTIDQGDELHEAEHAARASVRDIITWTEAIGMIIDGNMQSRSRSPSGPRSSGPPRGRGRGGRGRGRGRGQDGHDQH